MRIQGNGELLTALLPGLSEPCGGKGRCGKCRVKARGALSSPRRRKRPRSASRKFRKACVWLARRAPWARWKWNLSATAAKCCCARAKKHGRRSGPQRHGLRHRCGHDHAGGLPSRPGYRKNSGHQIRHEPATALWGGRYQPHPIRHARRRSATPIRNALSRNGGGRVRFGRWWQPRNDANCCAASQWTGWGARPLRPRIARPSNKMALMWGR